MKQTKSIQKFIEYVDSLSIDFTEDDCLDILKIKKRWGLLNHAGGNLFPTGVYSSITPYVEMMNNIGEKSWHHLYDIERFLDFDKFKHLYDEGYAFVITDMLDISEDFRNIYQYGLNILGATVHGNLYFSKGLQRPSYGNHTDLYDILIKNIYGESVFVIGQETKIIDKQQTLFIEKDIEHRVDSVNSKRLSLTIGFYS